ncbi:NADPH-dependent FMN reductase [Limimaricola litoreus]|uniref:NAD(P)H-dependent oxidoreductase n=1 Tax=Limimaricola litoreus TaxID=2955316 RepID=A0A9X2FSM4_9RHOB|nr:NADPH-dependent FMN reductase [Limimaricola litoreus]MCP1169525.1 NAD(P)H-dependent oxidoreductase [Limimaricola litoreus]
MRILGISGSLRQGSYNTALLRAAQELMPDGATLAEGSIADIPLYNGDEEAASGIPAAVETLKDQIAKADGLLLFTPEYNNSIPGVFKNAIDWTSRPAKDISRVFGGKPVAVLGASPGGFGTILSQDAWLSVLRTLGTRPWCEGRLMVARAGNVFDDQGRMTDDQMRDRLKRFLAGFSAFAAAQSD